MLILIGIIIFLSHFLGLLHLAKAIDKISSFFPQVNAYYKKIANEPIDDVKLFMEKISPNNIGSFIKDQNERKQYRKSYNKIKYYFIDGFIYVFLEITLVILSCLYLSGENKFYAIIIFIFNILITWILKINTVFRYWGFNKIANILDDFALQLLSSNGKISRIIYSYTIKFIIYIVSLILFYIYFRGFGNIISRYGEVDFLGLILELFIYYFGVNYIISIFVNCLNSKIHFFKEKDRKDIYYILKKTTYIVFFTIYIFDKYVQLYSTNSTYNMIFIEAISALFLVDSYCEKTKIIENDN